MPLTAFGAFRRHTFRSRATALAALGITAVGWILVSSAHGQTSAAIAAHLTYYTHGDPSPDEQYLLELLNAARAKPAAEGGMLAAITDPTIVAAYQYFAVNLANLRLDFDDLAAKPPLAFNSRLMASARAQSIDQATHGFQGHDGSNGSTFEQRITATGYSWTAAAENVYAYVSSPLFGFAGMMVDWGVPELAHRVNMMNSDPSCPLFKETGISLVSTKVKGFGPPCRHRRLRDAVA